MFKKSLLFIPIFYIATVNVFASEAIKSVLPVQLPEISQPLKANAKPSPKKLTQAKLTLAKQALMAKIAQLSAFSANFVQKVIDADGNELQENSGNLAVAKPNLLHWQVKEPNESLIVSDGKALWLYDPFIEQVSVYATDGAIVNTPILLLANPDKSVWQNYEVKLLNKDHYLITAKDDNSQVKSLELVFNSTDKNNQTSLAQFVILDATGQLSRVQLSKTKQLNLDMTTLFTFTPPKGVDVDDQR